MGVTGNHLRDVDGPYLMMEALPDGTQFLENFSRKGERLLPLPQMLGNFTANNRLEPMRK
eukprot:scaffold7181_cov173-Cylindrotheca_fusiformis.AAC.2